MMRYLSVCSGIEAATVAWHPLGWYPVAFAEIEPFPCAVLAHHYPDVPNLGDFTAIPTEQYRGTVDLVVGGTPCQAFSVAGLRRGLDDPRGNLTLAFLRLLADIRPRWVVWENVPGVLSIDRGRVFGAFLGGLAQLGYGFAYRILDAQYFGVPQRRRRVFVVGHLGDWRRAAAVLFERHSLSGNPAPSRSAGKIAAGHASLGPAKCLTAGGQRLDPETENMVCCANFSFHGSQDPDVSGDVTHPVGRNQGLETCVALETCPTIKRDYGKGYGDGEMDGGGMVMCQGAPMSVRRLTPRECERLQGFPDDYTEVPWRRGKLDAFITGDDCPDGPRYKALGNSMAVPVMRWVGERVITIEEAHR